MKKVLAFTLGTGLATLAMPSFAFEDYLDYVGGYVTATYTKPSNNGLSIGEMQTYFPAPVAGYPYSRALFLEPDFNWDYALGFSFHFPETCTRFYAEYDYFNNSDRRQAYGPAFIVGPANLGGGTQRTTNITGNAIQTAHEWRFGLRRFIPFGNCFSTQVSAFFEYDKVSQVLNEWNVIDTAGGTPAPTHRTFYAEFNSQFHGWGPGIGLGFRGVPFANWCHLGLFANVSTTLFYAKNLYNAHIEDIGAQNNINTPIVWDPENSKSLIGKYDINMGIDYLRVFCVNGCRVSTGVTLGIRYMNIVNAFKMGNTVGQSYNVSQLNGISNFPVFGVPEDWGRVGPYLRFNLGGADA